MKAKIVKEKLYEAKRFYHYNLSKDEVDQFRSSMQNNPKMDNAIIGDFKVTVKYYEIDDSTLIYYGFKNIDDYFLEIEGNVSEKRIRQIFTEASNNIHQFIKKELQ